LKGGRCIERRQRGALRIKRGVRVGERAPYFKALAADSGREVSLRTCAGRRLVLVFHAQSTAWAAERVNRAVRERYPSSEEVVVASVVDLSLVPPLYWLTASVIIGQAYEKAVREVAHEGVPGADPAEYVLILQDWGGLISQRFGVRGVGREAVVVVIDENADIVGFYQGREPVGAVLRML
jgi:plasmid stability protein